MNSKICILFINYIVGEGNKSGVQLHSSWFSYELHLNKGSRGCCKSLVADMFWFVMRSLTQAGVPSQ